MFEPDLGFKCTTVLLNTPNKQHIKVTNNYSKNNNNINNNNKNEIFVPDVTT